MIRAAAVCLLTAVLSLLAFAPAGLAARPNPAVQLDALSCAEAGSCSVVGTYDDGLSDSQGLLLTEAHGSWRRAVQAQLPANAAVDPFKASNGGGLVDVSCTAPGDCTAVGRYTDERSTDHGVLLTETRGRWGRGVAAQLPSNAIRPPKPKTAVVDLLGITSVSCSSPGNCVSVGTYESTAEVWEAMIIVQAGGRWGRAIEAPLPAGAPVEGQNAILLSVTCDASGSCSAAGNYVDASGHEEALLVSGSGGNWNAAPTPAAPSDANSDPNIIPSSIACADAGDCAAVGRYINPLQNSLGLLLSRSGGAWAPATGVALPSNAAPASTVGDQNVVVSSVACPQAGGCTAVGWYFNNDENGQALVVSQHNGAWQPGADAALPANAVVGLEKQSAGLDWISCASVGNCLATGVYTDSGYNSQGLLIPEVGGVWETGVESPLPANAGNIQYAAADQSACSAPGDCAVIGQYDDQRGDVLGYTLGETNGAWGRAAEMTLPPVNDAEVRLSLAAILVPAGKSASIRAIRRTGHYDYAYDAVEPGTATISWYAGRGPGTVLVGSGKVRVDAPGSRMLKLRLTAAGARALAEAGHVQLSATARFTPRGRHRAQNARTSFTLG